MQKKKIILKTIQAQHNATSRVPISHTDQKLRAVKILDIYTLVHYTHSTLFVLSTVIPLVTFLAPIVRGAGCRHPRVGPHAYVGLGSQASSEGTVTLPYLYGGGQLPLRQWPPLGWIRTLCISPNRGGGPHTVSPPKQQVGVLEGPRARGIHCMLSPIRSVDKWSRDHAVASLAPTKHMIV